MAVCVYLEVTGELSKHIVIYSGWSQDTITKAFWKWTKEVQRNKFIMSMTTAE